MKIETKYNLGDRVMCLSCEKEIVTGRVSRVSAQNNRTEDGSYSILIHYKIDGSRYHDVKIEGEILPFNASWIDMFGDLNNKLFEAVNSHD